MLRFLPFFVFIFLQCGQNQSESAKSLGHYETMEVAEDLEMDIPRTAEPPPPPQSHKSSPSTKVASKIIRNGDMSFEVSNLKQVKAQVDSLVKNRAAYYENEDYQSNGYRNTFNLIIRVPSQQFDTLVMAMEKGFGRLISKNIRADDVTEQYLDLQLRLENNLAYLARYNEILKKANSVKEILEVQEKIQQLEEEIESRKGRIKYLDNKVSYGTLRVELSELVAQTTSNRPHLGTRLLNAFKNGVEGFVDFAVFMVSIWPFVLFILLLVLFRKRFFSFFKRSKPSK